MVSVADRIEAYNRGRDPERLALKYGKMRLSPFVFLRGTCHLFYEDLPRHELLRHAPLTWCCGDLHLENFGSYKGDHRLVYFDINDFDEAALAPCTWDLLRFLTSVRLGLEDRATGADGAEVAHLGSIYLQAYAQALALGKARWVEKETAEGPVKTLLDSLTQRKRKDFLDARTHIKGKQRRLRTDNGKALPVSDEQRSRVAGFMRTFAEQQEDPGWFAVHDIARRVAGTGSLGVERYIIMVEGKGAPDGHYLLDLKQALPSALAAASTVTQPAWASEAQRVVSIQYRVQAASMAFLQAVTLDGKACILRGLQPSEDRVTLPSGAERRKALESLMQSCGQITAWDHLRGVGRQGSGSADELVALGQRHDWQSDLLALSVTCARQTQDSWQSFCAAVPQV